jgi:hypothetical protein
MLAQLLEQRGVRVRRVPYAAVAREHIAEFDPDNITVVAVSSLSLDGAPAHLRRLLRRLRLRLPKAALIVGICREGDPLLTDVELQQTLGATVCVASLRAAVESVSRYT